MFLNIEREAVIIFGSFVDILFFLSLFIIRKKTNRSISLKRSSLLFILSIYILVVISITQFPIYLGISHPKEYTIRFNIIPFYNTIKNILRDLQNISMRSYYVKFWIKNLLGNLLLFVPLGILLPLIWKKYRIKKEIIIYSFIFSFSIEIFQLILVFLGNRARYFDIDDIILNVLGALIGYLAYRSISAD